MPGDINNLTQLLLQLENLPDRYDRITIGTVLEALGQRSFAPVILVAGLVLFSPLSGIPGMPTIMGILVLLTSVQMLIMRSHFWLPQWVLRRTISERNFRRTLHWLYRPASVIDRWLQPRLPLFVNRSGAYLIAVICTLMSLALPLMELLPFSATLAGLGFAAFGLALVAHDGLLAVLAIAITGLVPGLALKALIW
ncbi:exopolysaccharide biosynthesis protein [Microbulbifer pacificus]|uniref:Exopolysaccharide biosynthesis protein n=1 Tax=Microbulbifer pacificus TaxID=407164 RepID=A0AAU0N0A7_9GAMM|nr:exopolysaccharide biosynthesis protein [Microbulbifer pacificus]WOX05406.1 exopolysaccharide biosynthesis protein [Microbulbifer pacificus]